jgi:ribosomal protein L4
MTELTIEEKQRRLEEARHTTDYLIKESTKRGYQQAVDTTKDVYEKFKQIELKERCLRVKFLDWLSDKLLSWGKSVHQMSVRIDSPCAIKLPEKKTEKSPYWTSKTGEKK